MLAGLTSDRSTSETAMPTSAIGDYMRAMQRKSAAARWADKSPEQRSAEMRRLRAKARKKKTKRPNN